MSILNHLVKLIPLLSAALAFPVSAQSSGVQYTVTVLGLVQHNYPNSYFSPVGINDNGVVVGSAVVKVPDNPEQSERGVLWQRNTHYTILGTLSENTGYDSAATWINNSGITVGNSSEHVGPGFDYETHPVMFTPNGIVNLGVKNSVGGWATGINNASQVVGYLYFSTPVQATEAFLYQNGVMTPLGYPVPTIGYSQAYAINNNGLIVGTAQFSGSGYGANLHAVSYANGTWTDLGTLGTHQYWKYAATSVNDSGVIVGNWGYALQYGIFIYQNGQMTDLKAPVASDALVVPIINNAGQIIYQNFIYQNGVWQDINTLIEPGSSWQLTGATAINNEGAIVGFISNASQRIYRAGLLTPVSSN